MSWVGPKGVRLLFSLWTAVGWCLWGCVAETGLGDEDGGAGGEVKIPVELRFSEPFDADNNPARKVAVTAFLVLKMPECPELETYTLDQYEMLREHSQLFSGNSGEDVGGLADGDYVFAAVSINPYCNPVFVGCTPVEVPVANAGGVVVSMRKLNADGALWVCPNGTQCNQQGRCCAGNEGGECVEL